MTVIARVEMPGPPPYVLELDDDRQWSSSEAPEIADVFNLVHQDTYGEWNGTPGVWQANDVALRLGGRVTLAPEPLA